MKLRALCRVDAAIAIAIVGAACSHRLDLGGGDLPVETGAGGSAGSNVFLTTGTGGAAMSIPVGAPDAGSTTSSTAALGQHCSDNTDCAAPQVCAQGRCHMTCSPSVGCRQGHRLLPCLTEFAAVPVCPLPCDPAWGQDSKLCTRAGEPDDGPPGLYTCPSFPPIDAVPCGSEGSACSMTCSDTVNSLRQDCDRGVCNCTYNGSLACRCVTTDPPNACSFCCNL